MNVLHIAESLAWDVTPRVKFMLPFPDAKPPLYLGTLTFISTSLKYRYCLIDYSLTHYNFINIILRWGYNDDDDDDRSFLTPYRGIGRECKR